MTTIILFSHITLLVISIVATASFVGLSMMRAVVPRGYRLANLVATTIGLILGAVLLIQHPVGSHCIELSIYVLAFTLLYRFVEKRSYQLTNASLIDASSE